MAIKTNDIQEFRNLGLENEFDLYDFGDLIESRTNFNYTGTVDPPGGAENSEYLVTLPIMFHKLTSKNFADEEELPEYRVEY
ncbi:MAG: hypothetical protein IKS18_11990 [Lachnospiraceae bacterium]|nr:hypothetical protein [Lachnospiraceae bacterium]